MSEPQRAWPERPAAEQQERDTPSVRLQCAALTGGRGTTVAFRDLDLDVEAGIVLALLGPGLDPLTRGGPAEAARFLHVSEAEVRGAVEVLRTSTRPYASVDTGQGHPLAFVDVVFRLVEPEGTLDASVPDAAWLGLSVAPQEVGLDRDARAWWAPHRAAAAQLIASIDARATMLSRVAMVLAERQRGFVLSGAVEHRPLRRSDLATELGVHPSTVGRAVHDKVARCPDGRVVPLEAFFGAATSIRHRVAEVVAAHPEASDAQLAGELERRGVVLARRTVAKYRTSLRSTEGEPDFARGRSESSSAEGTFGPC